LQVGQEEFAGPSDDSINPGSGAQARRGIGPSRSVPDINTVRAVAAVMSLRSGKQQFTVL